MVDGTRGDPSSVQVLKPVNHALDVQGDAAFRAIEPPGVVLAVLSDDQRRLTDVILAPATTQRWNRVEV